MSLHLHRFKKTRFFFVAFLFRQSSISSIQSIFFDVFASRRSISIFDRHIYFYFTSALKSCSIFDLFRYRNLFFELFSYRVSFMKDSFISITIESSTKSISIFSTFVFFFEKTISRTSSDLTKFFVFFSRSNFRSHFRSNLFVFQSYNSRKVIAMNFDIEFIHDDKRISNEKVSFIKRAKIDKNKNRYENDLHFIVEFLRRHSTKNRVEIKIKITYIKTHY